MYGVITCPKCGTVQGADLSHARIGCARCQHKIDLSRAIVHFSTDSPKELAEAVRRYAGLKRGQDIPFPVPRGTGRCRAGRGTVESTICELGRDKGDFTARDLSEILEIDGDDLDELIEELLAAGIMYETGPGTYRLT
ncbi:MAG: hypothetical protein ACOX80_07725 [Methanomassiliicoccaceae archaeon]|jgi:hypothetical protein|nr:hypothetical protein [Euryarchaeota archaeon]HOB38419.1 hypothetical protein [Methanomassiliicoccaceae archaeon]HOQ25709.1 hypothetical protein [Methanomassiliicoccaceae archaeon]HPP44222.1 hypothetical protein [Methanomassiliicoccaceae archaeon]HQA21536.1 hypothetical protein [Methanomassiliicoccaceae archaeon]